MNDLTHEECDHVDGGFWGHLLVHAAIEAFCHAVDFSVKIDISGPGGLEIHGSVSC